MPANIIKLRDWYESYLRRHADGTTGVSNPGLARQTFLNHFRHRLGLCDKNGQNYVDRVGNRILRECPEEQLRIYPEQFSLRESMDGIVGPGASSYLQDAETWGQWRATNFAMANRHPDDPRALLEAPGVGVSPSAFADINAWTAVNSGLIERRILEQFQNPSFVGDVICPDEPSRIAEGQKIIGAGRVGPKGIERNPGQPHPRAGIPERWITLPRTHEYALACDVTFEAAWFDLTGQVLETAAGIGEWLAYQKELRKIDAVIGSSLSTGLNTSPNAFKYNDTAYALFASSESLPVPKNSQSNTLIGGDWQTFKNSWLLLQRMRDPETGTRIQVEADTILTSLEGAILADIILGASDVQRRTSPAASNTQATATTLTVQNTNNNPATRFAKRTLTSSLVEQRMTDATAIGGLGLTQDQANARFWHMQAGKSHKNMVNWPLTVAQLPMASSYEQTDRRIVQTTFVSERSTPSVWSLWHIVQNTH